MQKFPRGVLLENSTSKMAFPKSSEDTKSGSGCLSRRPESPRAKLLEEQEGLEKVEAFRPRRLSPGLPSFLALVSILALGQLSCRRSPRPRGRDLLARTCCSCRPSGRHLSSRPSGWLFISDRPAEHARTLSSAGDATPSEQREDLRGTSLSAPSSTLLHPLPPAPRTWPGR